MKTSQKDFNYKPFKDTDYFMTVNHLGQKQSLTLKLWSLIRSPVYKVPLSLQFMGTSENISYLSVKL